MKNTLIRGLLVALISVTPSTAIAAMQDSDKIDSYIQKTIKTFNSDYAFAIAVVEGDEIIFEKAYGYSDIRAKKAASIKDSYYTASATKPLTAMATLRLADAGILDLDNSLASYFPEILFDDELKADQVTIRHLLNHTSGIRADALGTATAWTGLHTPKLRHKMLSAATRNEEAPFGTFQYTNLGYNILSMIIDRETDKPWQVALDENVFQPAKMQASSTTISDLAKKGLSTPKTYSYGSLDKTKAINLTKQDNTMHAAGGVVMTTTDMARFVIAQLNGGKIDGKMVFKLANVDAMQARTTKQDVRYRNYIRTHYGLGWNIGTLNGEELYHHFGTFPGTSTHVSFMPKYDLGVVIFTNEDTLTPVMGDVIVNYIYDLLLDKETADDLAATNLNTWSNRLPGLDMMIERERQTRASRKWQLSLETSAYLGTYSHPLLGEIVISEDNLGHFNLTWGNLASTSEAGTAADHVRVELRAGRGQFITFNSKGDKVTGLKLDDQTFVKNEPQL